MSSIIIATLAVAILGLLIGILLVTVDKKFKVEVDEKQVAIRECLPGNNCGGCGYAAAMPSPLPSPIRKHLSTAVRSGAIRSQKKSAACSVFRWKRQKKSPPLLSAPATVKMRQHDAVTSAFTIALPPQAADSPVDL